MSESGLDLSEGRDLRHLNKMFIGKRRIRIPDILTSPGAGRLHTLLSGQLDWHLAYSDAGGNRVDVPATALGVMPPAEMRTLLKQLTARASVGFQFVHNWFPVCGMGNETPVGNALVGELGEFLNSDVFLGLARKVTGFPDIESCVAEATLFGPGQFQTTSDGRPETEGRRAGFSLSLTRTWNPDWGGLLLFLDEFDQISEGYAPDFNSLSIYALPQRHTISAVAPFAGAPRLAITGWFRNE